MPCPLSDLRRRERVFPLVASVQGSGRLTQDLGANLPALAEFARRGYVVAVIEYRPCAAAPFPARIEDARTAGPPASPGRTRSPPVMDHIGPGRPEGMRFRGPNRPACPASVHQLAVAGPAAGWAVRSAGGRLGKTRSGVELSARGHGELAHGVGHMVFHGPR
ncbi:hypothetical protein ACFUCQ_11025 [Streptomyces sp. NPDC057197]|uniref:hypothetical protein n=1 Tax=Streptomyces sp. NPDC057197 TaxID=3346045 RepID=UPI003627E93B